MRPFIDLVFRGNARTRKELARLGKRLERVERQLDRRSAELADHLARISALEREAAKRGEALRAQDVAEPFQAVAEAIEKVARNEYRQREAFDALSKRLDLAHPLPPTRGWAGSPDFLLFLYDLVAKRRPRTVVELGSGISTIVVAAAMRANGGGHVHSLDHLAQYADATLADLRLHDLARFATVHTAPLVAWAPPRPTPLGTEWRWYGVPPEVAALRDIDLLIVDGPPEGTGRHARYPALPCFRAQMAPGGVVVLDDASRPDERAACRAWENEWAMRADYRVDFEKGLAILAAAADGGAGP